MKIKMIAVGAAVAALTLTGCPAPKKTDAKTKTSSAPAKTGSAPMKTDAKTGSAPTETPKKTG